MKIAVQRLVNYNKQFLNLFSALVVVYVLSWTTFQLVCVSNCNSFCVNQWRIRETAFMVGGVTLKIYENLYYKIAFQ